MQRVCISERCAFLHIFCCCYSVITCMLFYLLMLLNCVTILVCRFVFFFVFKEKTDYEMRISDWSSDVCSSDLMKGLEVEAIVNPIDSLTLSASFGLLDSGYKSGDCPANPADIPTFPAQLGSCVVSSGGPVSVGGNPFPYAAKSSASFAADWVPLDDGDNKLTIHGDVNYTGQFYFDSFKDYSRGDRKSTRLNSSH